MGLGFKSNGSRSGVPLPIRTKPYIWEFAPESGLVRLGSVPRNQAWYFYVPTFSCDDMLRLLGSAGATLTVAVNTLSPKEWVECNASSAPRPAPLAFSPDVDRKS